METMSLEPLIQILKLNLVWCLCTLKPLNTLNVAPEIFVSIPTAFFCRVSSNLLWAEWLITAPALFFFISRCCTRVPISLHLLPPTGWTRAAYSCTDARLHSPVLHSIFSTENKKFQEVLFFSTEESHYSLLWFPPELLGVGGWIILKIATWYFIRATQMCHLSKAAPVFVSRVKVRVRMTQGAVCFTANGTTTFLPFVHFKLLMHVCCFFFQRLQRLQGSKWHVRVQRNMQPETSQQRTLNPLFMASYSITM